MRYLTLLTFTALTLLATTVLPPATTQANAQNAPVIENVVLSVPTAATSGDNLHNGDTVAYTFDVIDEDGDLDFANVNGSDFSLSIHNRSGSIVSYTPNVPSPNNIQRARTRNNVGTLVQGAAVTNGFSYTITFAAPAPTTTGVNGSTLASGWTTTGSTGTSTFDICDAASMCVAIPTLGVFTNTQASRVYQNNGQATATVQRMTGVDRFIEDDTDLVWTITYDNLPNNELAEESITAADFALYNDLGELHTGNRALTLAADTSNRTVTVTATVPDDTFTNTTFILGPSATYEVSSDYGTNADIFLRSSNNNDNAATIPVSNRTTLSGNYSSEIQYNVSNADTDSAPYYVNFRRVQPSTVLSNSSASIIYTIDILDVDGDLDPTTINAADFVLRNLNNPPSWTVAGNGETALVAAPACTAIGTDTSPTAVFGRRCTLTFPGRTPSTGSGRANLNMAAAITNFAITDGAGNDMPVPTRPAGNSHRRLFDNFDIRGANTRVSLNNSSKTPTVARVGNALETGTSDLEWTITYADPAIALDVSTVSADASDFALFDENGVEYTTDLVTLSTAAVTSSGITVNARIQNADSIDGDMYILGSSSTNGITSVYGTTTADITQSAATGFTIDNRAPTVSNVNNSSNVANDVVESNQPTVTFTFDVVGKHDTSSVNAADFTLGHTNNAVVAATPAEPTIVTGDGTGATTTYSIDVTLDTTVTPIPTDDTIISQVTLLRSANFEITDGNQSRTTTTATHITNQFHAFVTFNNHELGAPTLARSNASPVTDGSDFVWTVTYPAVTNATLNAASVTADDFQIVDENGEALVAEIPLSVAVAGQAITVTADSNSTLELVEQTVALEPSSTYSVASLFGTTAMPFVPDNTVADNVYVATNPLEITSLCRGELNLTDARDCTGSDPLFSSGDRSPSNVLYPRRSWTISFTRRMNPSSVTADDFVLTPEGSGRITVEPVTPNASNQFYIRATDLVVPEAGLLTGTITLADNASFSGTIESPPLTGPLPSSNVQSDFTFDNIPPRVTGVTRTTTTPEDSGIIDPSVTTVVWQVVFDVPVTVDTTHFRVVTTDTASANIGTVVADTTVTDGTVWNVTATSVFGNGTITLGLSTSVAVADANGNAASFSDSALFEAVPYTLDAAPTIESITRLLTGTEIVPPEATSLTNLSWLVTFSEPVTGFDETKITPSGTTGDTPEVTVTSAGSDAYEVNLSGFTGGSTITFTLDTTGITDGTNDLSTTIPTIASYTYTALPAAGTAPTLVSVQRTTQNVSNTTRDTNLEWLLTFSAPIDPASLTSDDFATGSTEDIGDITVSPIAGTNDTLFAVSLAYTGSSGETVGIGPFAGAANAVPPVPAAMFEYADDPADDTSRAAVTLTFQISTTEYVIDTVAPKVTSVTRTNTGGTRQTMLDTASNYVLNWTVDFDSAIFPDTITNNARNDSFSVAPVSGSFPQDVAFNIVTDCTASNAASVANARCTVRATTTNAINLLTPAEFVLQINEDDFADTSGNLVITADTRRDFEAHAMAARYTLDDNAPSVLSFERATNPRSSETLLTSSRAISWNLEFSERIDTNTLAADDFVVAPAGLVPSISFNGTTATITVAFGTNDLESSPTEYGLTLASSFSIADIAGNVIDTTATPLPSEAPATYTVRHVGDPDVVVTVNTIADADTFDDPRTEIISGLNQDIRVVITYDLPLTSTPTLTLLNGLASPAQFDANDENTEFTTTFAVADIQNDGTLAFTLSDATDTYGNTFTTRFTHPTSSIDLNTAPTILNVTRAGPSETITNLERIAWRIEFSEPVNTVASNDFLITLDAADPTNDATYEPSIIGSDGDQVYLLSLDVAASTTLTTLADLEGVLTITWNNTSTAIVDVNSVALVEDDVEDENWETYTVDNTATAIAAAAPILIIETAVTAAGTSASPTGVQAAPAVGQSLTATPSEVGVNGTITITVRSNIPLLDAPELNIAGFATQPTLAVMTGTDDRVWTGTITISDSQPTSDGPLQITVENYESAAADPVSGTAVTVMTTLATMNPNEAGTPIGAITVTRDARIASITRVDDEDRGFADSLSWTIVFSSGVRNVDVGDFCVMSAGACTTYTIESVSSANPTTYSVMAMPANDIVVSGVVSLSLRASHDVVSLSTNAQAVVASPMGAETYTIDSTQATMGPTRRVVPVPDVASTFISNRASQLVASLPDLASRLSARLGSRSSSGNYSALVDNNGIDLSFSFNDLDDNIWGNVVFTAGSTDTSDSDSLIVNVGVDKFVTPSSLLGVFFLYDSSSIENAQSETIDGTGWLVGPYIASRLDHSLTFTGRVGIGESTNEGKDANGAAFEFDTERVILTADLSGHMDFTENWDLSPEVGYTYFSASREAGARGYELNRLEFGPRFFYDDRRLSPTFGVSGIWNFTDNDIVSEDELSLRLDGGISMRSGKATRFDVEGFLDGIGGDFETYGISLGLSVPY